MYTKIFRFFLIIFFLKTFAVPAQTDTVSEDTASPIEEWEAGSYDDQSQRKPYFGNYDYSAVQVRTFDEKKIQALKDDPELSYGYTKAAMSLWDAFWIWVHRQLSSMFEFGEGNEVAWRLLLTIGSIVVLAYVILKLLKLDNLRMLYGGERGKKMDHLVIEENIHEMDFEKLLDDAVQNKNFRLAIRVLFLYGLKMLSDKHHIYWEPGKTNHDYLYELRVEELKGDFRQLNYYFEYAWYGNFVVTNELFNKVNTLFTNWRTKI